MLSIPVRVALRHLQRIANTVLTDDWIGERTQSLGALLRRPIDGSDWGAVALALREVHAHLRATVDSIEQASNYHPYFLQDLRWIREEVDKYPNAIRDYERGARGLAQRSSGQDPLWDYFVAALKTKYKKEVKTVGLALRVVPYVSDFKVDQVNADVRTKARAAGLDPTSLNPTLLAWLQGKGVKDRVFRQGLVRGGYADPEVVMAKFWATLREQEPTDESYGVLREFTLGRAKLILLDPAGQPEFDASLVQSFARVKRQLEAVGLGAVWYGPLFHVSQEQGKLTGEELAEAQKAGYDLRSYSGRYNSGQDWVVVHGWADDAANTLAHELGHRWYMKFLSRTQRLWFQERVRTRPAPIDDTPESREKYLKEMDYLPGDRDDEGELKPLEPVSTYGGTNAHEAFAELFMQYVRGWNLSRDQRVAFRYLLEHVR